MIIRKLGDMHTQMYGVFLLCDDVHIVVGGMMLKAKVVTIWRVCMLMLVIMSSLVWLVDIMGELNSLVMVSGDTDIVEVKSAVRLLYCVHLSMFGDIWC